MTSLTVNLNYPPSDSDKALMNALLGSAAPVGGAGGPVPVDNFPADPGKAPFPSPENSTMTIINGALDGAPYLRSLGGAIWEFTKDASGKFVTLTSQYTPGTFYQLSVNGVAFNAPVSSAIIRQGQVYFNYDGVATGTLQSPDNPNSGVARTTPPPAWTSSGTAAGGGTIALPAMPADPAYPLPGSSGRVVNVPVGTSYADYCAIIAAAAPGDTIDGGGRITAGAGTKTPTWAPGCVLDATGLDDPGAYPHQLGGTVPMVSLLVRGFEFTGFGMKEDGSGGTAAIRNGGPGLFAVDHCHIHGNQNGIFSGGFPSNWEVSNSFLHDNGLDDGKSHNMYFASAVRVKISGGVTSIDPVAAHALKSRANSLTITGTNYFNAANATPIDLPDGTTEVATISTGTTIAKTAGDANHGVIGYCMESQLNGASGVKASCAFDLQCDSPLFQLGAGSMDLTGSTFTGNKPSAPQGSAVTGMPT